MAGLTPFHFRCALPLSRWREERSLKRFIDSYINRMKIAHIAPPWIPIPPKNYGGTEIVIYNLVEEQVAQGHDVTLFAPGDAKTSANLVSFFSKSLLGQGVPWAAHLKAYYHMHKSL